MHSMTGCGNGIVRSDGWEVSVEIRTVNHRFLDISMRLPRNLSFLEQPVRSRIAGRISRGHADVYVTVKNTEASVMQVEADFDLARHYADIARTLGERTGTENDLTVSTLMQMEGVTAVSEREMDRDKVTALCDAAADAALDQLTGMREKEGENLKKDLRLHLDEASALRESILRRAPLVVEEYKAKLENRLKALDIREVDPQRLAQEVALMADRCAIDEELARLDSHIRQLGVYLETQGEIGKKMDFLIQEMNREANTIGSKASDAEIAQAVVNLKSEIEKLREQIQNVE
ncbi:MAG: YicC family protein [Clostridiales bacterium]|nr:YicC family protein [Clostridiales bacterium]